MTTVKEELHYAETHEWVSIEEDVATVGISDHAQDQLGELVFVELPEVGQSIEKGSEVAVVESVKAATDVYAPISGEIVEVNEALESSPNLINDDPYGEGWIYRAKVQQVSSELDQLMTEKAYADSLEG